MKTLNAIAILDFEILKIVIGSTLASLSITWWIWIVHCTLGQLQSHQINFLDLLFECFRSLLVVLIILTLIAFL